MISERVFASVFRDFWRSTMPRSEHMTLLLNASRINLLPKFHSFISNENRGLINETAVRLAAEAYRGVVTVEALSKSKRDDAALKAKRFVDRFRSVTGTATAPLIEDEMKEAVVIGQRLLEILCQRNEPIQFYFPVSGAGVIDQCVIDALTNSCVIEVKAGNRAFRSEDVRQGLVYAALLHLSQPDTQIHSLCLINPRLGWYAEVDFDHLLHSAGGFGWSDFVRSFDSFVSDLQMCELETSIRERRRT